METIKNLVKAFIGESQARNRYTFYAKTAKKEGYEQISEIFTLTAENEREHAKQLYKLIVKLNNGNSEELKVEAEAPIVFGNTIENLKGAIKGEDHEFSEMYPEFADVAEKEGFRDIAARLRSIAEAEMHHRDRYKELLKSIEDETIWKKDKPVKWVCRKCGYVHEGEEPPEECPSCDHEKNYFEILCEDY
jgi:rubrerythrin